MDDMVRADAEECCNAVTSVCKREPCPLPQMYFARDQWCICLYLLPSQTIAKVAACTHNAASKPVIRAMAAAGF